MVIEVLNFKLGITLPVSVTSLTLTISHYTVIKTMFGREDGCRCNRNT